MQEKNRDGSSLVISQSGSASSISPMKSYVMSRGQEYAQARKKRGDSSGTSGYGFRCGYLRRILSGRYKEMLNDVQLKLLEEIADLHGVPEGAYNIRANGEMAQRNTTANVDIVSKEDVSGIDIFIRPGTKNESIHIPVVLSKSGIKETVYNDFHVGDDCDVLIVAGCGIDNCGTQNSEHDGVHRFFVRKDAKVRYVEKHYGSGEGEGKRILNPVTEVLMEENRPHGNGDGTGWLGGSRFHRPENGSGTGGRSLSCGPGTSDDSRQPERRQFSYEVKLNGEGSSADVISRSVAKDSSYQKFDSRICGNAPCTGHTECDAIIMDNAKILAIPQLEANDIDAALIHEAAIGKIAGEQIIKLMTSDCQKKRRKNRSSTAS